MDATAGVEPDRMRFDACLAFTCGEDGLVPDKERGRLLATVWNPLRLHEALPGVDLMLFDDTEKRSVTQAVTLLQRAIGLQATGVIDCNTVRWAKLCSGTSLAADLASRQVEAHAGDPAMQDRVRRRHAAAQAAISSGTGTPTPIYTL